MNPYRHITVIGAGAWGTALASVSARNGHRVRIWTRNEAVCQQINRDRENGGYLPGVSLPASLEASTDMASALDGTDLVLIATPAQVTRDIAGQIASSLRIPVPLISCAKGISKETGQLQTQILEEEMPECPVGVLSGPSFADDVARGLPTAVVLATTNLPAAQEIATALSNKNLRLYASSDLVGVQLGGALKNVMAIAIGICRGGGLGVSAEAALTTRGFIEISRLAISMGARFETLTGLSCLGDLILTCSSTLSRNFSYGIAVGKGINVDSMKLVEGVYTIGIANELARTRSIECPIMEATQAVLEGRLSLQDAYYQLMNRPVKPEIH